jgi:parallel beta-helix repeat protein
MRKKATRNLGTSLLAIILVSLFILPSTAQLAPVTTKNQTLGLVPWLYVNVNNTQGPWDGSPEHPYQYIQQAIDHAGADFGIYVYHGTYHEDIVLNQIGLEVIGENRNTTIIDRGGFGTCVRITHDNVILTNFTIQHSGNVSNDSAVTVYSTGCYITKNLIRNNHYGIYALGGANYFFLNNFENNTYPAIATQNNTWDNGFAGNYWEGLPRTDDNENGIIDTPYNISTIGQDRYPLVHRFGSIIDHHNNGEYLRIADAIAAAENGDIITVAPDVYWEHFTVFKSVTLQGLNQTNTIIDGRLHGTVISLTAQEISLRGFTVQNSGTNENDAGISVENHSTFLTDLLVQNNHHGIVLKDNGSMNLINVCTIRTNAWNGVYILGTTGNQILENVIQDNGFSGVMIFGASYNSVYHNQFLANRLQAFDNGFNIWDNGYPSGGNHWSDYTGTDANHDGIGDTPYVIPGGTGVDRYPLMSTYQGEDTMPPYLNITSPVNGVYLRNHRFMTHLVHKVIALGRITITVNASDISSGVKEVRFYVDEGSDPAATVYAPPYTWTFTGLTPIKHAHTITVEAFDYAGNSNQDIVVIHHWL